MECARSDTIDCNTILSNNFYTKGSAQLTSHPFSLVLFVDF